MCPVSSMLQMVACALPCAAWSQSPSSSAPAICFQGLNTGNCPLLIQTVNRPLYCMLRWRLNCCIVQHPCIADLTCEAPWMVQASIARSAAACSALRPKRCMIQSASTLSSGVACWLPLPLVLCVLLCCLPATSKSLSSFLGDYEGLLSPLRGVSGMPLFMLCSSCRGSP